MNDCTNLGVRDRLPDLLHEQLDASARALVLAHLDGCVDCRDELRLLGEMRSVIEAGTPRVDMNYVIHALPKAPAKRALALEPRRRVWADWRVAAAVTLIVAGGSSVALLNRDRAPDQAAVQASGTRPRTSVAAAPKTPAVTSNAESATTAQATTPAASIPRQIEIAATTTPSAATDAAADPNLSNLSSSQLKTLLQDIDNLKALPVAEPEPVSLRVNARSTGDDIS